MPNSTPPEPTAIRDEDTLGPVITFRPPPLDDDDAAPRWSRSSIPEARRTLLSIVPLFNPRWAPWSPSRVARTALGFAAVMALLVMLTHRVTRRWAATTPLPRAAAAAAFEPVVTPSAAEPPRADAALAREHRSPLAGGLLIIPPAFRSPDGAYDLAIHFHGNTDLVEESYALSGLDAVVVIMNLGIGSGPYEDRFANAAALPEVLDRVQATMEKRGLAHARLRRLALTAWSAGYGAVLKILEQPALARAVDAVLLLDGIHVGYQGSSSDLHLERLTPFERFARRAIAGETLFSITHSNITPNGNYAGTHVTTDALLSALGTPRSPGGSAPETPALRSIVGVIAKKKVVALTPETTADQGGLHVRGFAGDQPEDHIAHLIHMARTALPDLVERWRARGPVE